MSMMLHSAPLLSKQRGCVAAGHAGGLNGGPLLGDGRLRDFISEIHHGQLGSTSGADTNDPLAFVREAYPFAYFPAVAVNYLSMTNVTALAIAGDLDLRGALQLDDWTPSSLGYIQYKHNNSTTLHWEFTVQTNGKLRLTWSPLGTNAGLINADSSVAPTVADGALLLVRATIDVDNGASGYDVKFWTKTSTPTAAFADMRLHTGWTQLGTTVTGGATTSLFPASSFNMMAQVNGVAANIAGRALGFAVYDGIAGTEVFALDCVNGIYNTATTSMTATTGQTVTVQRSTSGRKTAIVKSSFMELGSDDYIEALDNAALNVGLYNDFTLAIAVRQFNTPVSNGRYAAKQNGSAATAAGYTIKSNGTSLAPLVTIGDGTLSVSATGPTFAQGIPAVLAMRRRAGVDLTAFTNAVAGTPVADTLAATLLNANPFRIGSRSDSVATLQDFDFFSWALFNRALIDREMLELNWELGFPV